MDHFKPAIHATPDQRPLRLARLIQPMQAFVQHAQSGGIVLLLVTLLALIIANSSLGPDYLALLEIHAGISLGPYTLDESLLHWINDGLMTIFFFLIGLEIKREILVGELASVRAAALPIIAATGGVLVPAAIYAMVNAGGPGGRGWGVPMATDIAFTLGCLALLGTRVPFALKVFLTAVAIVDDLMAVLVIAIFYSGDLNLGALGIGLALLLGLVACNRLGVRRPPVYAVVGVLVWLAFLVSGIHATLAGVAVALTIPARYRIDAPTFLGRAHALLQSFPPDTSTTAPMLTDETQQSAVLELEDLCEQVQAPLQKIEHRLHGWVTWLIMPLFAFANAGVVLSLGSMQGEATPIVLGVVLGLTLGKPIGLVGATWLAVRLGLADLPRGATWKHMIGAGMLAGIGFTMSIFITTLAFERSAHQAAAKGAILLASVIAGSAGMLFLRQLPAPATQPVPPPSTTGANEAERSQLA
jgi:Na+:H+ antiporter, NhaA family